MANETSHFVVPASIPTRIIPSESERACLQPSGRFWKCGISLCYCGASSLKDLGLIGRLLLLACLLRVADVASSAGRFLLGGMIDRMLDRYEYGTDRRMWLVTRMIRIMDDSKEQN